LKTTSDAVAKREPVEIGLLGEKKEPTLSSEKAQDGRIQLDWETGKVYGEAQNLARTLKELPANRMTPTIFCETAEKQFAGIENVTLKAHDLKWAEEKKMGSFISVSRGSDEPLRFLELHYKGAADKNEQPLAFVGKGITFDSGGISLKPGAAMKEMRADMGGAATTLSAAWAIAKLKIPINRLSFIHLSSSFSDSLTSLPLQSSSASPSPRTCPAARPPSPETLSLPRTVLPSRSTTPTLRVASPSLTLSTTPRPSSSLVSSAAFLHPWPSCILEVDSLSPLADTVVDVATLTGAMMIALGNQFTGVFTNSDSLYEELDAAGKSELDRVWRMPLDEGYQQQINGTGCVVISHRSTFPYPSVVPSKPDGVIASLPSVFPFPSSFLFLTAHWPSLSPSTCRMDLCNTGGRLGGACTAAIFLKRFVDGLIVDGKDAENQEGLIRWAHLDIAGTYCRSNLIKVIPQRSWPFFPFFFPSPFLSLPFFTIPFLSSDLSSLSPDRQVRWTLAEATEVTTLRVWPAGAALFSSFSVFSFSWIILRIFRPVRTLVEFARRSVKAWSFFK
jgi:hypothetical protein